MKNIKVTLFSLLALVMASNAFATIGAVVSVSPSTALINQLVTASISITNTGSAMNLTSLAITANYNGVAGSRVSAAFSTFNLGPNAPNLALAANSTTVVPMQAIFFAPSTGVTGSGTGKYYIGATFTTSDGSITSAATAGRVTVNPLPLPQSQL